MAEYKIVKRMVRNPRWSVIVTCQGQPFEYQHSTLIGGCFGLVWQYVQNHKYGTMNFSLRQYWH